jgi:lipopolysaccharide transport system ATP-binding protein
MYPKGTSNESGGKGLLGLRSVNFAEMWEFIEAPLRTYSSGMGARFGFAVATDVNAHTRIVDEVLSVGDEAFQRKSLERIQRFRRDRTTLLFVSHNPKTVESMCDRVIWIDHGLIKMDGSASDVVREYRSGNFGQIQTVVLAKYRR